MAVLRIASFFVVALASALADAAVTSTVVDVPTRNVTQRFLYLRPDAPVATILALPGGSGVLNIQSDGTMNSVEGICGPFVRNRLPFANRGFAIASVDAASDGSVGAYEDILEVIRYLRRRDNVPVWITGGSSSTPTARVAAVTLAADIPAGLVFFSPAQQSASSLALVKRPTLVIYHVLDPDAFGSLVYSGLTAAPVRQKVGLTGGNNGGCGYHLFNGLDAEFVAATSAFIDQYNPTLVGTPAANNYQGLFYNAPAESEAGWGINFAHQGDIIFATWFTYDATGKALWLSMTAEKSAPGVYGGTLYQTRGPAFSAVPFSPAAVTGTAVGSGTLTFSDVDNGSFAYVVNGISQTKTITRQVFAAVPTCAFGAQPNLALATNYQDLWYAAPAESEAGWGVNFTHQGDIIFATWFTYDVDGTPLWLSATARKAGPGVYMGTLYRTRGPAFNAVPFPKGDVVLTPVGTLTLTFANGNSATFGYTLNGVTQTKAITRQVFRTPGTACQ